MNSAALPLAGPMFPEDQLTDRSSRFVAAEFIREQLIERLGQEVPYRLSDEIEDFEEQANRLDIGAVIWVERESQKQITIGKKGVVLKQVGSKARAVLEELFGEKVYLVLSLVAKSALAWQVYSGTLAD